MKLLTKLMIAGGVIDARTYPATFNVLLSSPVGATIADGTGVVTINNSPITANVTTNRTADSNTGVAPFAVQFDATGTTSVGVALPFRDLYHSWNFGDNDTVTWGFGTQAGVAKKNRATNALATHVFETPGVYTVSYLCINPLTGATASTSTTITVLDPDVVFAANTVYVSTGTITAGAGGVPSGANVASNVTTNAGIASLASTYKRILLKRADNWTAGATANLDVAGPGIIAAFGTGAKPKISFTATAATAFQSNNNTCQDWRFVDIESEATGLATGAARNATSLFGAVFGSADSGRYSTFLRCDHHHAATFVTLGHDSTVADCNLYLLDGGGGNVGIWTSQRERVSIIGTNVDDATAMEMNIRLQGTKKAVVSHCYIKDPTAAGTKHALAIRGWSNSTLWTGDYTEHVYVSDCHIEGISAGNGVVQFESVNSSSDERHRYIIFERNFVKCKKAYGACISASVSYSAFRNNLMVPDLSAATGLRLKPSPAIASNGFAILPPVDVQVLNNSVYTEYAATNAGEGFALDAAESTSIVYKNNIVYLPNYSMSVVFMNYAVGAGFTASNNSSDAQVRSTAPGFTTAPPVTYADWKPTTGYTINAGANSPKVAVYDDFFSVARTGTPDMGAVQP